MNFKSATSKSANFRIYSVIVFTNMKLFAISKEHIFEFVVITCNKNEDIYDYFFSKVQVSKKQIYKIVVISYKRVWMGESGIL